MPTLKIWMMVGTLALAASACNEAESGSQLEGDAGVTGGDAAACSDLSYETFGQAFLESYCTSCHGAALAQAKVRLDTLAYLQAHKSKARSEVSSGSMPPRGATAPSSSERALFSEWISCGAN